MFVVIMLFAGCALVVVNSTVKGVENCKAQKNLEPIRKIIADNKNDFTK